MNDSMCPTCGGPRDAWATNCRFCGAVFEPLAPAPRATPPAPPATPLAPPPGFDRQPASVPGPSEVNPYAPPATLEAPALAARSQVPARRLSRLAAHILDMLLAFGAVLPGFMVMTSETLIEAGMLLFSVGLIAIVAYNLVLLHRQGQTLGKKILKVRIRRSDGTRASLRRIVFLRALFPGVISAIPGLGALFGLLDALWIFGAESRCIHDYLADTVVVEA